MARRMVATSARVKKEKRDHLLSISLMTSSLPSLNLSTGMRTLMLGRKTKQASLDVYVMAQVRDVVIHTLGHSFTALTLSCLAFRG